MNGPRIGSLCSGYSGLDMGLMSVVGGSVAWHVEYDKAPAKILDHHWPDVPNYGDITTTDWTQVEPVDWLTAGYPCQPFSHAGKRKGTTDERHIWPFVAGAIGVLRPRRVLLENVRGHLTLGFDSVLADLARLGYDATWGLVRAADAGAPHSRARLFVVAVDTRHGTGSTERGEQSALAPVRAGESGAGAANTEGESGSVGHGDDVRARRETDGRRTTTGRSPATDTRRERYGRGQDSREVGRLDRDDESETRERSRPVAGDRSAEATADTGSGSLAGAGAAGIGLRLAAERGAVTPADAGGERLYGWQGEQGAGRASRVGCEASRDARHSPVTWGAVTPADTQEHEQREPSIAGPLRPEPRDGVAVAWGAYEPAIRRWEAVTGRPAPAPTEPGRTGQRLSPRFVEWMMGLPAGHVTDVDIPRNAQLKALGNGVVPAQAALALRTLLPLTEVAA